MAKRTLTLEMNRVEGDVEIKVELDGDLITNAWCAGTMYRGFEQILLGRAAADALVITPRICGICSTSQLYAAVTALETAAQAPIAPNGTRIRNLCLMAEELQSDARQTFLMFAVDFCNPAYRALPLYPSMVEAFEPFKGRIYREVVQQTKRILSVVVSFGGSWPHSTYMMPGGSTSPLTRRSMAQCLDVVDAYCGWYEQSILGCSFERWSQVDSFDALEQWLAQSPTHADSAMGLYVRFGRAIGLHQSGLSTSNLLSYGTHYDPELWQPPFKTRATLGPAGFYNAETRVLEPFDPQDIAEHVRYSWFKDWGGGRHPSQSDTTPDYRQGTEQYTFAKAPRYQGLVVQVGPLADLVAAADPLITSLFNREGPNTWLRQLTRIHRPVVTLQRMREHILALTRHISEPAFIPGPPPVDGEGVGLINAARGSLGHWIRLEGGKITGYQIITPTTWNGSPRDSAGQRGHWEESLIGMRIKDPENPIEVGHLIRSHDACLVCTVHYLRSGKRSSFRV